MISILHVLAGTGSKIRTSGMLRREVEEVEAEKAKEHGDGRCVEQPSP